MKKITKQQRQLILDKMGKNVLFAVGINKYVDRRDALSCCEKDAEDVYSAFVNNANLNLEKDDSVLLRSSDMVISKKVIMDKLENICHRSKKDLNLIFYYSGHGMNIEGTFHFLLQDSVINKSETLLSIEEIYEIILKSKFNSIVLLIDACQTKQVGCKGLLDKNFNFQKHFIENAKGVAIIYSCSPGECSQEAVPGITNSVFTSMLLEALSGKDDAIEGHYLSVKSMMNFFSEESQRLSSQYQQVYQHPYFQFEGVNDIFLGLFNDDAANCIENDNSCTINVAAKSDFFEQDEISKKLRCLLKSEHWSMIKGLIGELIYNIYMNNGEDVDCKIEISKRKITIIDSGKPFNPLELLDKYDTSGTKQIGAQYLTTVKSKLSVVEMKYNYKDNLNNFIFDFTKNAFVIDGLCTVNVLIESYFKKKVELPKGIICKTYYYHVPSNTHAISFQRDIAQEIIKKIPQNSKLIIVDNSGTPDWAIRAFGIDERIVYTH